MNLDLKDPLVSIIIPSFNSAKFLPETLACVSAQTYMKWECIIIDDGSTDNTSGVVSDWIKNDNRYKYFFQENRGLPYARNNGLKHSRGDYIQFLDADDLILPEKLEYQLKYFSQNPYHDIVYSEYQCFYHEKKKKRWTYSRVQLKNRPVYDFISNWERGLSIPIHCFLYKADCFRRWGVFDEIFREGKEDWDLHIRFAAAGGKFLFLPGITSLYRQFLKATTMAHDPVRAELYKKKLLRKYIYSDLINFKARLMIIDRMLLSKAIYVKFRDRLIFYFKKIRRFY